MTTKKVYLKLASTSHHIAYIRERRSIVGFVATNAINVTLIIRLNNKVTRSEEIGTKHIREYEPSPMCVATTTTITSTSGGPPAPSHGGQPLHGCQGQWCLY
ncbi:putative E3 ubiquitin-protein ligase [Sesbania bispinosa]|nr:putative E3 ubiquitin-protein ligase [Sesbania bispinosa]